MKYVFLALTLSCLVASVYGACSTADKKKIDDCFKENQMAALPTDEDKACNYLNKLVDCIPKSCCDDKEIKDTVEELEEMHEAAFPEEEEEGEEEGEDEDGHEHEHCHLECGSAGILQTSALFMLATTMFGLLKTHF